MRGRSSVERGSEVEGEALGVERGQGIGDVETRGRAMRESFKRPWDSFLK